MEALLRYEEIVSASKSFLAFVDRDHRYQAVNQKYVEMYRHPKEFFIGRRVVEVLGDEAYETSVKPALDRSLAGETVSFQYWMNLPSQGSRYLDAQFCPFVDGSGDNTGVIVEVRDVTEQKRLEGQIRQGQKLESVGTLAAGIAHDFNNILMAIMGFGQLTADKVKGIQGVQRYVDEIMIACRRAKDLVEQILVFSRHSETERKVVDLRDLVKEAMRFLRASLPATIDLRQSYGFVPLYVSADSTQIHQVLVNLGTNAEYAMRGKNGVFEIMLEQVQMQQDFVSIHHALHPGFFLKMTIWDNGPGIPQEILPKIFDPFFTTKEVGEGTGMGLAQVHGIISAHGGAVTVESSSSQGTTFCIYLPQVPEPTGTPIPSKKLTVTVPDVSGKILFLDDEPALTRLGKELLETQGMTVEVFNKPKEAITAFRNAPEAFDVIITDHTMPKMTGEDVVREMLSIKPNIPIILCTGYNHSMNQEKAQALGVKAFLMKPLQRDELFSTLCNVLGPQAK